MEKEKRPTRAEKIETWSFICFGFVLAAIMGTTTTFLFFIWSPQGRQEREIMHIESEHQEALDFQDFEKVLAGLKPIESLKDPKKIEFVRLAREMNDDPSSLGKNTLRMSSLQRSCIKRDGKDALVCDKNNVCEYVCLGKEFELLGTERFTRLIKGDQSAIAQVNPITKPVQLPTMSLISWVRILFAAWFGASLIGFGSVRICQTEISYRSRALDILAWTLYFPATFAFRRLFPAIWKFALYVRKSWLLLQIRKMTPEVKRDLAELWSKLGPYRDKPADTEMEKLRILREDRKTPLESQIRLAKFIRVQESLNAMEKPEQQKQEGQPQEVEPQAVQPADAKPATQTA